MRSGCHLNCFSHVGKVLLLSRFYFVFLFGLWFSEVYLWWGLVWVSLCLSWLGITHLLKYIVSLLLNFGFCKTFFQVLFSPVLSPSRTLITQILALLLKFHESLRLFLLFLSLFYLCHSNWVIFIVLFLLPLILSSLSPHYAIEIIHWAVALVIVFFSSKIYLVSFYSFYVFAETSYFFDWAFCFLICFKHIHNG